MNTDRPACASASLRDQKAAGGLFWFWSVSVPGHHNAGGRGSGVLDRACITLLLRPGTGALRALVPSRYQIIVLTEAAHYQNYRTW